MSPTTLVNDTDQTLVVVERTSNSTHGKPMKLKPREAHDLQARKSEVVLTESLDRKDSMGTFRVWKDLKSVLGVNNDEIKGNKEIIIKYNAEEDCFTKESKPRSETDDPSQKS